MIPAAMPPRDAAIVAGLDPLFQPYAIEMWQRLRDRGIRLQFNSGFRTGERQAELAAAVSAANDVADLNRQGLTGIVATPGNSLHEAGLAFDGEPQPKSDDTWAVYGEVAEGLGLEWGGRYRRTVGGQVVTDRPHVQLAREPSKGAALVGVIVGLGLIWSVLQAARRA